MVFLRLKFFSILRIFDFIAVNNDGGEIMKRFIVTLVLTAVIVGVLTYFMPKGLNDYIEEICPDATVSIYCRNADTEAIDMGSGKIVECGVKDFHSTLSRCKDVDGFSISFCGTAQDVDRIAQLFNLKVTSTLDFDGLQIVCGISEKLKGGVILDGEKVNLQIAFNNGTVTVGSPLILGSY